MANTSDTAPRKTARSEGDGKPAPGAEGADSARASVKAGRRSAPSRRPARKTFLVAATVPADEGAVALRVYAAVTRTPAEALAAVREALGSEVAVDLTGKLSDRMAKSLGLKPGEVRRI